MKGLIANTSNFTLPTLPVTVTTTEHSLSSDSNHYILPFFCYNQVFENSCITLFVLVTGNIWIGMCNTCYWKDLLQTPVISLCPPSPPLPPKKYCSRTTHINPLAKTKKGIWHKSGPLTEGTTSPETVKHSCIKDSGDTTTAGVTSWPWRLIKTSRKQQKIAGEYGRPDSCSFSVLGAS